MTTPIGGMSVITSWRSGIAQRWVVISVGLEVKLGSTRPVVEDVGATLGETTCFWTSLCDGMSGSSGGTGTELGREGPWNVAEHVGHITNCPAEASAICNFCWHAGQ